MSRCSWSAELPFSWRTTKKIARNHGPRPAFRLTGLIEADEAYVGGAVSGGKAQRASRHPHGLDGRRA